MVGAGAVVTKDVAPYALVVGVPASQLGWVCRCGEQIVFEGAEATCGACGDRYALGDGAVSLVGGGS